MHPVVLKECVWRRDGDALLVMFSPTETIRLADASGQVERLLIELRGAPRGLDELHASLAAQGIATTEDEVGAALQALDAIGLVENGTQLALDNPDQHERHFSTAAFFSSFSSLTVGRAAFVRRLRAAHVLQLGVGGIGSSVVQCLSGMGVGRLTLVDDDVVEPRNFARQFLYRHADLGRRKVDRAAEWVHEFDPSVEVRAVARRITAAADVAELLDGVDVVVSSIDEPADVGLWVNEAAVAHDVPVVRGGVGPLAVTYSSVDPGRSACRACMVQAAENGSPAARAAIERDLVRRLSRPNGSTGPMVALAGSLVALEVVRFLTAFQPPLAAGARVVMGIRDGLTPQREQFARDADCPVCRDVTPKAARHPS